MKPFLNALIVVVVLNALALLGVVTWLKTSGRLNRERVQQVAHVFRTTVEQEAQEKEAAAKLEEENRGKSEDAARLESIGEGPQTVADRIKVQDERETIAMQRVERLRRETSDLRAQIEEYKVLITRQRGELEAERKKFEEYRQREEKLKNDRDFQQAVEMYEKLKPRQAKEMFQTLLKQGKTGEVLDYLGSMQIKKATDVLKEFKTPEEVAQATDLVQRLRERGIDPSRFKLPPASDST